MCHAIHDQAMVIVDQSHGVAEKIRIKVHRDGQFYVGMFITSCRRFLFDITVRREMAMQRFVGGDVNAFDMYIFVFACDPSDVQNTSTRAPCPSSGPVSDSSWGEGFQGYASLVSFLMFLRCVGSMLGLRRKVAFHVRFPMLHMSFREGGVATTVTQ